MNPRRSTRIGVWIAFVFLLSCGLLLCLFPIGGGDRRSAKKSACLSNIKQILIGMAIYVEDFDQQLPPYYSFEGSRATDSYVGTLWPYLKNNRLYVHPGREFLSNDNEAPTGLPIKDVAFDYAHCLSLQGMIPKYSEGNRVLPLSSVAQPSETPYLRDPIFLDPKNTGLPLQSPHGEKFNIGYLDFHVKGDRLLNINRDL